MIGCDGAESDACFAICITFFKCMARAPTAAALVVCGALPIYVPSAIHEGYGVASTMSPDRLEKALAKVRI